jgi:hypothetical protein
MLELVRKNTQLYVKVLMNISLPIQYQNRVFNEKGDKVDLLLEDEVMHILARNGNIKCWTGEKFIKLNLGQFYDVMQKKNYKIVEYVEPKVEVKKEVQQPKVEVVKEEPKVEPKKEEPKIEVKKEVQQPKVEEVVNEEQPKQHENNKKQRHNNNNNKQQGGDK